MFEFDQYLGIPFVFNHLDHRVLADDLPFNLCYSLLVNRFFHRVVKRVKREDAKKSLNANNFNYSIKKVPRWRCFFVLYKFDLEIKLSATVSSVIAAISSAVTLVFTFVDSVGDKYIGGLSPLEIRCNS